MAFRTTTRATTLAKKNGKRFMAQSWLQLNTIQLVTCRHSRLNNERSVPTRSCDLWPKAPAMDFGLPRGACKQNKRYLSV
jgi:hypothetical protein